MKLIQEAKEAMDDRKFIKSQVEKRRRERMNHSLERLRTMLLQQQPPPLGETPHRMEKTEILEQTVLFLQNAAKANDTRAGGGGHACSVQDGFTACLQRAARFLGPEGKGLWLGAALDASLAARFASTDPEPASRSAPCTMSILRMLRQKSKHSCAHPYKPPVRHVSRTPQHSQRHSQLGISVETGPGKPNPTQTLWRPWP